MHRNIVKVNIFGTEYPIKGDSDSDYIQDVASYVNNKMIEIEKSLTVKSSLKVAILAALNIADELYKEKSDKNKLLSAIEEKSHGLNEKISRMILDLEE
ncbi:cell division protein ZapA [candidate division KSB1 bacterium]